MNRLDHVPKLRPEFGLPQGTMRTGYGPKGPLRSFSVEDLSNPDRAVRTLQRVIAENVRHFMELKYHGRTNQPLALAKAAGIGKGTVQRVLDHEKDNSCTVDTLMRLAWVFNEPVWNLLVPRIPGSRVLDTSRIDELTAITTRSVELKRRRS